MTSRDSEGPYVHEYVVRFGDDAEASSGFEIVSSSSLVGSEVSFLGTRRDGGTVMSIIHPAASCDEPSEPAPKRYRGYLEPPKTRTEQNCPADVPLCTWLSGVSAEPLRGFETRLRFLVAPQTSWTVKEIWVHGSTTSGDAKHYLKQFSIPESEAQLFGLVSQEKIPWHKKLLEGSHTNWAPTEDRVLIPSSFRLDLFMVSFGVFELCIL